jgi:hypothetical protein
MDIIIKTEFYSRVDYTKMATTQRVSEFQGIAEKLASHHTST